MVWPRLAVLPMGWTHALHLCQSVAERASDVAKLPSTTRVVDRQAAPDLKEGGHLEYVDNFAALAFDKETVQALKDRDVSVGEWSSCGSSCT